MVGKLILGFVTFAGALGAVGGAARAQEVCAGASMECPVDPGDVVVTGSPALEPFFRRIGDEVKAATGIDVFYVRNMGQCLGAQQVSEPQDMGGKLADYLEDGASRCCTLRTGAQAHLWVNDSAVEDCFDGKKPEGYRDYPGPIAAYTIVVPKTSPQRAITAEEAYFVFGFGSAGYKGETVKPWTDVGRVGTPGVVYGAQALWAKFLRLPSAQRVKGQRAGGPDRVIPMLLDARTGGESAIGLTSAQAYDGSPARPQVKALAVRAWKQQYAFYADSTPSAFDKRNVRDGHYPWWARTHLVLKADATGRPLNARAEALVNYLLMITPLEGAQVLDAIIGARLVPSCAMKVQRAVDSGDAGELVPYKPAPGTACGCYMDELVAPGSSGCAACSKSTPCPNGKVCSNGFCE